MATTAAGRELTAGYRAGQLQIRARALRDVTRLWRVVDVTALASTISTFSDSAAVALLGWFGQAAGETVDYLHEFRDAEGAPGADPDFGPAPRPDLRVVSGLIRGAALSGIVNARRAGRNIAGARDNGLVKVVGDAGKTVMGGGRLTVLRAVQADRQAAGFRRVTSSGACDFCRMLASRGPVYKSERTADFRPHGHCGCVPEIVYGR